MVNGCGLWGKNGEIVDTAFAEGKKIKNPRFPQQLKLVLKREMSQETRRKSRYMLGGSECLQGQWIMAFPPIGTGDQQSFQNHVEVVSTKSSASCFFIGPPPPPPPLPR